MDWRPGRRVAALLQMPVGESHTPILLAPGAGAGQAHHFPSGLRRRLAAAGHPTMSFDYPYAAEGRRVPDRLETLAACHRAAARLLATEWGAVVLAGKSMGGRVATHLAAEGEPCAGVVCYGYPLLPRATLQVLDGGDHSFGVRGTPDERGREVLDRLADWTVEWLAGEVPPEARRAPGPG